MNSVAVARGRTRSRRTTECSRFELREWTHPGEHSLHALRGFAPGDVLTRFEARSSWPESTRLSLQISESEHIELSPEFLQYTNHSCRPNVMFDVAGMAVLAITPIRPGDEITFFYPSTEWEMAHPFRCECGLPECLGRIQGAAFVSGAVLRRYSLAEHIETLLIRRELALDEDVPFEELAGSDPRGDRAEFLHSMDRGSPRG